MLWVRSGCELLAVNAVRLVGCDMVAFTAGGRFVIDRDERPGELRERWLGLQDRLVKKGVVILPAGYD